MENCSLLLKRKRKSLEEDDADEEEETSPNKSQRILPLNPATLPSSTLTNASTDFQMQTMLYPTSNHSENPHASHATTWASSSSSSWLSSSSSIIERGALDPELNVGITFEEIGAGLVNLGNTCFLNSVLQCLTYTEPFAVYILSEHHKTSCHIAGFCTMCAFQNHVRRVLQSNGETLAPIELLTNLNCIFKNFCYPRQEDAHECMVNLLEAMHKCCLPSGLPSESFSAYEKSLVHKIFGGLLRSQVRCTQCSQCTDKFDPFLDLSLEIVKVDSLLKALWKFTDVEQLDGGERHYQCQQCKQKVRAVKKLTIHKAPSVLAIHLKRFSSYIPGLKINHNVNFATTLDLKAFVSDSYEGDLKYTLYGVLVHAGKRTHSGHYYCFVRTSSGKWYALDDDEVFQVRENIVLEQKAYMLFYVHDRKNFSPKKPVVAVHKENLLMNLTVREKHSVPLFGLEETIRKGLMTQGLNNVVFSSVATQTNVADSGLMKDTLVNKTSSFKCEGSFTSEPSAPLKDPLLEIPLKERFLLKDPVVVTSLNQAVCGLRVQHSISGHIGADDLQQQSLLAVEGGSTNFPHIDPLSNEASNCKIEDSLSEAASLAKKGLPETTLKKFVEEPLAESALNKVVNGVLIQNSTSDHLVAVNSRQSAISVFEGGNIRSRPTDPLSHEVLDFKTDGSLTLESLAILKETSFESSLKEVIESEEHLLKTSLNEVVNVVPVDGSTCDHHLESDLQQSAVLVSGAGGISSNAIDPLINHKNEGSLASETLTLLKEPLLETSVIEAVNEVSFQHCDSDSRVVDGSQPPCNFVIEGGGTSSHSMDGTSDTKTNPLNEHEGTMEGFNDPVVKETDYNGLQNSTRDNLVVTNLEQSVLSVPKDSGSSSPIFDEASNVKISLVNEHEEAMKDSMDLIHPPLGCIGLQTPDLGKDIAETANHQTASQSETLANEAVSQVFGEQETAEVCSLLLPNQSCIEKAQECTFIQHLPNAEENEINTIEILRQSNIVESCDHNKELDHHNEHDVTIDYSGLEKFTSDNIVAANLPQSPLSISKDGSANSLFTVAATDVKTSFPHGHKEAMKDTTDLLHKANDCISPQSSDLGDAITERATHEIETLGSEAASPVLGDCRVAEVGSLLLPNQSCIEKSQGCTFIQHLQNAGENEIKSIEILSQLNIIEGFDHKKALDYNSYEKLSKPKNLKKFNITSMHFFSKPFFQASMNMRRKRKYKNNKMCSLKSKLSTQNYFKEAKKIRLIDSINYQRKGDRYAKIKSHVDDLLDCNGPENSVCDHPVPDLLQSAYSIKSSGISSHHSNCAEVSLIDEHEGTMEDLSGQPSSNGRKMYCPEKIATKMVTLKNLGALNEKDAINKQYQMKEENGSSLNEIKPVLVMSQSNMANDCDPNKVVYHHSYEKLLKPKKNLLKFKATSRCSFSKALFMTSLGQLRRKKNHERGKSCSLVFNPSTHNDMEEVSILKGEPSTSKKTKIVSHSVTDSKRQHGKSKARACMDAKNLIDSYDDFSVKSVETQIRERFHHCNVVHPNNEMQMSSSSSKLVKIQWGNRELDGSNNKTSMIQNSSMRMLERGLEGTTVALWDHIECLPSEGHESSNAQSIKIGHVPDEWAKKYDQGKKRKVRTSKKGFNPENPFQTTTTGKSRMKKTKMDQSSSRNQPLRI